MFDIDDFQPITLDARSVFDKHYARFPPSHSENAFTTLVSWNHFLQSYYLFHDDDLMIMTRPDGGIAFRPPSGNRNSENVKHLVQLAMDFDTDYPLVLIDNETKEWLSGLFPAMDFAKHEAYFDYVYLASDLADLEGKKYLKIRNKLNRFKRQFEYEVEPLCHQNSDEIGQFLQRWCLWRDCGSDPLLEGERIAVMYTIEHCFDLDLSGLAIRIDGEVEAVTVFESMNKDTAVIHLEKAMPDFDGLYQLVNNESANLLAEKYEFIDRQSDLGIQGLRVAKRRYHPHHMVEVQHMIRPGTGELKKKPEMY